MPRGGRNRNTFKPLYNAGPTCTIRVPEARKKEIQAMVKGLDAIDYQGTLVITENLKRAIELLEQTKTLPKNNATKIKHYVIEALELLGATQDASDWGIREWR
jgi:hypothetical protein